MWSRRKLCATALALLRGELRLCPRPPRDFHPNTQSCRAFARSFLFSREPRVSVSHRHVLLPESRVSCSPSYSLASDEGGGGSSRCWNCDAMGSTSPTPFLACISCRSVQPVEPSVDYFQIFGLERKYDIMVDSLEGKYKDWQKKLHPDLVHSKSEKERTFAAEQSARVIDAYRTLCKPLSRALYLLQLEGIQVDEEKTITDAELLAEMMDIRENVEEANDYQALKQIQSQIEKKFESWSNSFREAFDKQDFDDAIASIQRMRYYDRAIEEIVKKL